MTNNDKPGRRKNDLIRGIVISLSMIGIFWIVKSVELVFHVDFGHFGIFPRSLHGFAGILSSPFIHGNLDHILSNSVAFFWSVTVLYFFYRTAATRVLLVVYLFTGLGVWIAARGDSYHVGASGIVYGVLSFVLFSGFFKRERETLALSLAILFIYGFSFFYGLFPEELDASMISWESHLIGAIVGAVCSVYFGKRIITVRPKLAEEHDKATSRVTYNYYFKARQNDNEEKVYTYTVKSKEPS